jgi:hypothetical protein
MADKLPFEEPVRRAMDANLRYYEALAQVTQDYWKAIFGIVRELPIRIGSFGSTPAVSASNRVVAASTPASAATLVLEGETGSEANGVFMVENKLGRTVSTAVITSAFADPSGRALQAPLRVVPGVVTLEPGGRTLVQIYATVTDDLEPDVSYRGEVNVPGLSEHGIPLILRRRGATEPAKPAKAKKKTARRRRGAKG